MAEWWGEHQVDEGEPTPPDAWGSGVDVDLPAVPKPLSSSILWTPRAWDSAEPPEARDIELFVWQAALKEIAGHRSTPRARECYGMLSGRLVRCPESGTPYLSIEGAHPAPHSMPETEDPIDLARFREFWLSTSMKASVQSRTLVGWYHAHPRLGVAFSKSDERIHLVHFPNRWQCALVLASRGSGREAGFFQRDARSGAFRSTPAPFYEVVRGGKLNGGRARSWVGWANYKPDRSITKSGRRSREAAFEFVSIDSDEVENGSDRAPLDGKGTNGNKGRADRDEASAETGGAPAPTLLIPSYLKAREARRRRRRIRRRAMAAGVVALLGGGLAAATTTGRVDLAAVAGDARAQTTALAKALAETLIPTNGSTADGQAGAVPMARGQRPGAPSADRSMEFATPPAGAGSALRTRIEEYERIREAAASGGATVACETLLAAFTRVEAAAASLAAETGPAGASRGDEALSTALEDVRRDFEASGCSPTD